MKNVSVKCHVGKQKIFLSLWAFKVIIASLLTVESTKSTNFLPFFVHNAKICVYFYCIFILINGAKMMHKVHRKTSFIFSTFSLILLQYIVALCGSGITKFNYRVLRFFKVPSRVDNLVFFLDFIEITSFSSHDPYRKFSFFPVLLRAAL